MPKPASTTESLKLLLEMSRAVHDEGYSHTIFAVLASVASQEIVSGWAIAKDVADNIGISQNAFRIYVSRYRIFFATNEDGKGYRLTSQGVKAVSEVFKRMAKNRKKTEAKNE